MFVCLQSAEGEGSCRVRSLSHEAFLSVFSLLSGSCVRLIIIKQTPLTPFRLRRKGKSRLGGEAKSNKVYFYNSEFVLR